MTILVENECLSTLPDEVSTFYSNFPQFQANASILTSTPVQTIKNERVLYVAQGEYAIIKKGDAHFNLIGTDDATTCHIIVMKNQEESTVCVAHIDSANCLEALSRMVLEVVGNCSHKLNSKEFYIELSIVGGYQDERTSSEQLTLDLLQFFHHHCRVKFKLANMCVGPANTTRNKGINWPIIYGIAVDMHSDTIYPAFFPVTLRGPLLPLRSSRFFCETQGICRYLLFLYS